jgi:hypothetical protein
MVDWPQLIPPTILLSIIVFVCLTVVYSFLRSRRFDLMMKSLASDFAFNYTQPILFRPPAVNGFYRGREVVVDICVNESGDTRQEYTRVRVFHNGNVDEEFTVGRREFFSGRETKSWAKNLDVGNPEFERGYGIRGNDIKVMRKFLDSGMQQRILDAGLSFTVGRYDVLVIEPGRMTDKTKFVNTMDFLVDAAAKADLL